MVKIAISLVGLICLAIANPALAIVQHSAGSLIKSSQTEVFLVTEGGVLRWIPNEATFNSHGYDWSDIIVIPDSEISLYTWGPALPAVEAQSKFVSVVESEARVRQYFADVPAMILIAKCESGFRQFTNDGQVLRSRTGLYLGVFQVDEKLHTDWAKSLGMDIYTLDGNLAYARHLYQSSGTRPWPSCALSTATAALKIDLKLDDSNSQVKILQQLLNKAGFTIAESGVGSPGNETEYFGSLTRAAVQRFQCSKGIVCEGDEDTTGYGKVGPKTRAILNNL